jgi:ribosome-binding factor A
MKKEGSDGRRKERVEREIQNTIAQFLIKGFKTPLPGLVTVSAVRMPGDLRTAKVYISVLGSDNDKSGAMKILEERAFEVQNFIGRELKMRYCPKITFLQDDTTEKVLKIEKILQELKVERQGEENKAKGDPEVEDGAQGGPKTDQDDE